MRYWPILFYVGLLFLNGCNKFSNTLDNSQNNESRLFSEYIELVKDKSYTLEERKKNLELAYQNCLLTVDKSDKLLQVSEIARQYYKLGDQENFKLYNTKAFELALLTKDSIKLAESYFRHGLYFRNSENYSDAYSNFYKAKKIYEKLDDNPVRDKKIYAYDYGKALIDLARIMNMTRAYMESEGLTIRAIEKFKLSGKDKYLSICYSNLGSISKEQERYLEAIDYHLEAIKYGEKIQSKKMAYIISSYNNIGNVYKLLQDYEKAESYYRKGLGYKGILKSNPSRYSRLLDNLGYTLFLKDKDNTVSLELFHKAFAIRDSINDKSGIINNALHLSEYYKAFSNDSLAIVYANIAKNISIETSNREELLNAYKKLSEIYKGDKGLTYSRKYIKLNDSIQREERLYRDKFARIQFETDEKEQQIQEVQNRNTIYLLGIVILGLLASFVLFFFRARTKYLAQQNKIVQFQAAYDTETRISKRLHDDLGNDIFQVMLQYQHDKEDPAILEKLNVAYNKARDISRENSEFETDETYAEELANMLRNYAQNGIQLIVRGLDKVAWDSIEKTAKINIYRVLQELMTNMQKHSQATLVAIVFKNENKVLNIKYSDNGVGMDQALVSKNGLRNTEKRIQAIKGTLIFTSEREKGFKAEMEIPT